MMRTVYLFIMVFAASAPNSAAGPADSPAPAAVRFRRVLVPQQEIQSLTHGYMPMDRNDFQRRLKRVAAQAQSNGLPTTRVSAASFHAVLHENDLINGMASLQVVCPPGKTAVMPLVPFGLAIGTPNWFDAAAPVPATAGTDARGRFVVLVDRAGVLRIPWSLHGRVESSGDTLFDLHLPTIPRKQIVLDLPLDSIPETDRGLVRRATGAEAPLVGPPLSAVAPDMQRWLIELGGGAHFRLRMVHRAATRPPSATVQVWQETAYRANADSLVLEARLRIDAGDRPLTQLLIDTDSNLEVTGIRTDKADLQWQTTPSSTGRKRRLRVVFPAPGVSTATTLHVSALATLQVDSVWRLPTLHVAGARWRQGSMTLTIAPALQLCSLVPYHAAAAPASTVNSTEADHRFLMFDPDGAIKVFFKRRGPEVQAALGTTIHAARSVLTALTNVDLRCGYGQLFAIDADVPAVWTIDGVDTVPADMLQSYRFLKRPRGKKRLQVQFAHPLAPGDTVRLTVRAHRTHGFRLRADAFRPLQLVVPAATRKVVALSAASPFRFVFQGDAELKRLDPDTLTDDDKGRLEWNGTGPTVFIDDSGADLVSIRMTREVPVFAATVHAELTVGKHGYRESYRIVCRPESVPMDQFLVHLSAAHVGDIHWASVDRKYRLLRTERLAEGEQRSQGLTSGGETWRIVLPYSTDQPVEITAWRETSAADPFVAALASLPAATSQECWLSITSLAQDQLVIDTQAVRAVPPPPTPPDQYSMVCGRYRYDPARNPRITVSRRPLANGPAHAWAWDSRLVTRCSPYGTAFHRAIFHIENHGAEQLTIELARGDTLQAVELDGQPTPFQAHATSAGTGVSVTLPKRQRFVTVVVSFETTLPSGRAWRTLAGSLPNLNIPVLEKHWTVWLPPGFVATGDQVASCPHNRGTFDWRRRLFGPLAAAADARPFPLAWLTGRNGTFTVGTHRSTDRRHAALCLELLGKSWRDLKSSTKGSKTPSWRDLLRRYVQRARAARPALPFQLWIDAVVLTEDGFSPDLPVPVPPTGDTPMQTAVALLARANLVLAVHGKRILLTDGGGVCRYRQSVESQAMRVVAFVQPESVLAKQLESMRADASAGRVPAATWTLKPALPGSPWNSGTPHRWLASQPCQVCELPLTAAGNGTLRVVRTAVFDAIAWALLLIVLGLQMVLSAKWPWRGGLLIVVLAAVALVVPSQMTPITAGMFLGAIAGWLASVGRSVIRTRATSATAENTTANGLLVVGTAVGAALAIWLAMTRSATAQQLSPETNNPDNQAKVFRVFVPVDDKQQPAGRYDYLPLQLYDIIHRASTAEDATSNQWLVRNVTYRAVFSWRQARTSLDLSQLTATYQLRVNQPQQRVRIAWPATRSVIEPVEARLAGKPVELQWDKAGTAFTFVVPNTGAAKLELMLRPAVHQTERQQYFRFAIAPIPQARLELVTPPDASGLQVPSRVGARHVDVESTAMQYDLGPATLLEARWDAEQDGILARRVELDEFMVLRAQPANANAPVIVELQLKLQTFGASLRTISLVTDKSLRLLSATSDAASGLDPPLVRDEPRQRVITFPLREPVAGNVVLRPRFAVVGLSGIGNLCIPRIECPEATITHRWLAVVTSPSLEFVPPKSESIETIDSAEFLKLWGSPLDPAPRWACQLAEPNPSWLLAVRQRAPRTKVQQQLDITVSHAAMQWVCRAQLETTQGTVTQQRFSIPVDATVTAVVVRANSDTIAATVKQGPPGQATVFLSKAMAGKYEIELRGQLALGHLPSTVPLPLLELLDAEPSSNVVRLFRRPEVRVAVQSKASLAFQDVSTNGKYEEPFGRRVATLAVQPNAAQDSKSIMLAVQPNRPKVNAKIVTTLRRQDDKWEATAQLQVVVPDSSQGVLDAVRVEIPDEWHGPFTIDPEIPYQVEALPGEPHAQLIMWPSQPISKQFSIRIQGALSFGDNQRVRTPDIMPMDVSNVQRYYILPTRRDQQRIDWKTSGLQPVPMKNALPNFDTRGGNWAAYRVWSRFRIWSQPRAVIADVRRVAGTPRISLADVHIACRADGFRQGVVTFDIEPAGAKQCTLDVPAGMRLAWVGSDQTPATLVPLKDGRWSLHLGATQWPRQITVVFQNQGATKKTQNSASLAVPWITDLAVQRTLWTVRATAPYSLHVDSDKPPAQVPAIRQVAIRLSETANVIDTASDSAVDSAPEEVTDWYVPWAVRLVTNAARIRGYQLANTAKRDKDVQSLGPLMARQQLVAERLRTTTILDTLRLATHKYPQPADLWGQGSYPGQFSRHYVAAGPRRRVTVRWTPRSHDEQVTRVVSSLLVILIGGAVMLLQRKVGLYLTRRRAWWLAVASIGVVWWSACQMSWLGLLMVMAVVIVALAHRRQGPTETVSQSDVTA